MGRKNKLRKFAEILSYPNVVENYDPKFPRITANKDTFVELKGRWAKDFFRNNKPIVLELACGRGEYSLQLGRAYPERNFLGVDIKGARIWKGAKKALQEGLTNVGFFRTRIEQIDLFFDENEVDEIWITFPDPYLSKERKRLTSPIFLDKYRKFLKKGGLIHLKTDDDTLYESSLECANSHPDYQIQCQNDDIYSDKTISEELTYKTYYEAMHLADGKTIKYIQIQLL